MGDGLLSQSDIDALIKGQPGRGLALSKARARTAADAASQKESQPPEEAPPAPVEKMVSPQDVVPRERSQVPEVPPKSVSSFDARVLDLEQRLSRMETVAGRLEHLEKKVTGAQTAGQVSPQQLQAVVKRVQELSEEVRSISTKLQGTLGYDAYHIFECDRCSSHGAVATVFKCTKCGHESWRGWWPKK